METIRSKTFEGEVLEMDHKHFIECTLINCILRYSGQALVLEKTTLRGCNYVFFGLARGTVHFLQMTGLLPDPNCEWGELAMSEDALTLH